MLFDLGWRKLFFIAGAPGFLIAVLIWLMADPPRGASDGAGHGHGLHGGGSWSQYLQLLRTKTLVLIILAQAFAVFFLVPLIHFGVEFFVASRGMPKKEARIALGLIALVAGALGNSLSGVLGDRLARRWKGAYALLAGISFLIGWPCLLVGFHAESRWVYLPALTLGCFCYFLCMPAVNTQIANVVSPAQRASAWALAVFILHLLGDTIAAPLFGKVLKAGVERQQAFAIFSTGIALAGFCCLLAAWTAPGDIARIERTLGEVAKTEDTNGAPGAVMPGFAVSEEG